jgi:hypothetical protein
MTDNAIMVSFTQPIAKQPYASFVSSLEASHLQYVYLSFFVKKKKSAGNLPPFLMCLDFCVHTPRAASAL